MEVAEHMAGLMRDQTADAIADQIKLGGRRCKWGCENIASGDPIEQHKGRFRSVEVAHIDGWGEASSIALHRYFGQSTANYHAAHVGIKAEWVGVIATVQNFNLKVTGATGDCEVPVRSMADHAAHVLREVKDRSCDDSVNHGILVCNAQPPGRQERRQRRKVGVWVAPRELTKILGDVQVRAVEIEE